MDFFNGALQNYENKVSLKTVIVNDSTNVKKTINYLLPQVYKHKKDHDICRGKSRSRFEKGIKM